MPVLLSFEAPVTLARQFISFLNLNTPRKAKIIASLKEIITSSGRVILILSSTSEVNLSMRYELKAPPPVIKIASFWFASELTAEANC